MRSARVVSSRPLIGLLALCGAFLAMSSFACADALAAEIFVRFEPSATAGEQVELLEAVDGERERTLGALGVQVVEVASPAAALARLNASGDVDYAELAGLVYADLAASDPFLGSSAWQMSNTGFPTAWDRTTGSSSVVVAVLDTGVHPVHEDLGTLVAGYDFINGDADPADDHGHGTAVAGVVAAQGGNNLGVAGACWRCSVMPVKVLGANGTGTWSAVAAGLLWATDQGADVINMSLSGLGAPQTVADAVAYAVAHDVVVVASAGNDNVSSPAYPASFTGVISVGAVDANDVRYAPANGNVSSNWGSNWGGWVKVVAPGCTNSTYFFSTYPLGTYVYGFCGTSTAAPYVAGLAGLMRSYNSSLSASAAASAIYSTATSLPGGLSQYGRINADAAMAAVAPPDTTAPETSITAAPASSTTSTSASLSFSSTEAGTFECSLDGAAYTSCSNPKSYNGLAVAAHAFSVRATDAAGNADVTPAVHSWTVLTPDTTAPNTSLTSMPDDSTTSTSASFSFSSTEAGTFECSADGAVFAACSSPKAYTGLATGAHAFSVRATDDSGNVDASPASDVWTVTVPPVDTTAPETSISAAPASSTTSTSASFSFSSTESGLLECSLDGAAYAACSSPQSYSGLGTGVHAFFVRATDAADNTDTTPDFYTWTVSAAAGGGSSGGGGRPIPLVPTTNAAPLAVAVVDKSSDKAKGPALKPLPLSPDLETTLAASRRQVAMGGRVTYTLRVVNNGDRASAVVVSLRLPRQMTVLRAPAGCSRTGAVLHCKLGALRAGKSLRLTVHLKARLAGKGTVRATASASGERQAKDNVASVAVKVA